MAEALARELSAEGIEAISAGTDPRPLDPRAVEAMAEVGIDISGQRSKPVLDLRDRSFDFVISLCDRARESCVALPTAGETIHWRIDDPTIAEGPEAIVLKGYRRARDDLKRRIGLFLLAHRIPTKTSQR